MCVGGFPQGQKPNNSLLGGPLQGYHVCLYVIFAAPYQAHLSLSSHKGVSGYDGELRIFPQAASVREENLDIAEEDT